MSGVLQTIFAAAAIRHEQEGLREENELLRELLRAIRSDQRCAHWHEDIDVVLEVPQ